MGARLVGWTKFGDRRLRIATNAECRRAGTCDTQGELNLSQFRKPKGNKLNANDRF